MTVEDEKKYKLKIRKLENKIRDKDVTIDKLLSLSSRLARENEALKKELFDVVSRDCGIGQFRERGELE